MSRLDEIAKRNKQANSGGPWGGIVGLFSKLGSKRPPPPDIPGMRRKSTTSPLIVIPVMLVIGAFVGWYACSNTGKRTEYEQRMMGEGR